MTANCTNFDWNIAANIATVLAALSAPLLAWWGLRAAAKLNVQATESGLLMALMYQYASQEMVDDLRVLVSWKKDKGDDFAGEWREENPIIAQHLAKYDKLHPALALILHLVECAATGQRGPVTEEAALRAAAWCEYLEAHARRCYGLLADDGLRSAQALAEKVKQGKLSDGFTARAVRRNQWRCLTRDEAVPAALDWLEDEGWLRADQVGARRRERGGAPGATSSIPRS
jgi:Protein of unknown function (DUF3987)